MSPHWRHFPASDYTSRSGVGSVGRSTAVTALIATEDEGEEAVEPVDAAQSDAREPHAAQLPEAT